MVYKREEVVAGPFCAHGLSTSYPCPKCLDSKRESPLLYVFVVIVVLVAITLVSC